MAYKVTQTGQEVQTILNEVQNKTVYSDATQEEHGLLSAADKTKLDGVETGAEANVQSNWNEIDSSSGAFIKNKPTNVSSFANDAGYLTQHQDLSAYANDASYDSRSKKILLKHDNTVLAEIDATEFIKDGMVSNVVVSEGYVVITFNTDSGKSPISIPLSDFFTVTKTINGESIVGTGDISLQESDFVVTLTTSNNSITADKTYQQISEAWSNGTNVYLKPSANSELRMPLTNKSSNYCLFELDYSTNENTHEIRGYELRHNNNADTWEARRVFVVQEVLAIDATPTQNSENPVESGGVKDALDAKQDALTFDNTPTASSTNPVTSGGVKSALDAKKGISDASAPVSPDGTWTLQLDNGDNLTIDLNHDHEQIMNKDYSPSAFGGLGRKSLEKNIQTIDNVQKNILTSAMIADENTIYHIQYDYDLAGQSITIPANSALKFDGGKISNGTLVLTDTSIESAKECFGDNLTISGNALQEASPDWFVGSDADKIEKAINTFSVVKLAARDYLIDRQIEVHQSFKLSGAALADFFGEGADASGIRRDMSQSRLMATDTFNATTPVNKANETTEPAIIKVSRGGTNHYYYSIAIENVSFVGKNRVGYGLAICTPNGPSRPVSITNCNFKYFNHAIDINKDGIVGTSLAPVSTNVGVFALHDSNVTNNNYGLYVSGNHALMLADIKNNNLEANTYSAIYAMDDSTRENGTATIPIFGNINIENNLLEGQPAPISLRADNATISVVGNYFESVNEQVVQITGANLNNIPNVVFEGNVNTSNNLRLKFTNADVKCDNGNHALELTRVTYDGIAPTKLEKATCALLVSNPATTANYTELGHFYPVKDSVISGDYSKKYVGSSSGTVTDNDLFNSAQSLTAGRYRMVTKVINYSVSSLLGMRIGSYADGVGNVMISKNPVYLVSDVVLNEAATSNISIRVKAFTYPIYLSDCVVVQLTNETPYLIPRLTEDAHNVVNANILDKTIGDVIYDTTLKKEVSWDGSRWLDNKGFSANVSKGTTAQRPTALFGFKDDGYSYYDTDIRKEIYLKSSVGTRLINQTVAGQSGTHISNTCVEGNTYRASLGVNVTYTKKLIFRKAEDSTDGEIVIFNTASKDLIVDFVAPSATEYPYIYMYNGRPSGSNQMFYIDNVVKDWIEEDGATAGTLRRGTTANRPASSNIYIGFTYHDTDLGTDVVWNGTAWEQVADIPDGEDITSVNNGTADVLKLADKSYDATTFSGLGRKYLRKNIQTVSNVEKNILTSAMIADENTIYHIQYDYDLNGQSITIPAGCTLQFDGGSLKNGTIVGNNTVITDSFSPILSDVTVSGSFLVDFVRPEWFKKSDDVDDTASIQRAYNFLYATQEASNSYKKQTIRLANKTYVISPIYTNDDNVLCCLNFRLAQSFTLQGEDRTKIEVNYSGNEEIYAIYINIYQDCRFEDFTIVGNKNFSSTPWSDYDTVAEASTALGKINFLAMQPYGGGGRLRLSRLSIQKFNIGVDFSYNHRYQNRAGVNGDTNQFDKVSFGYMNYGIYIVNNSQATINTITNSSFYQMFVAGIAATSYQYWKFENLSIVSPSPFIKTISYTGAGGNVAYTQGVSQQLLFNNCKWEYDLNEWNNGRSNVALIYQDATHGNLTATFVNCGLTGGSPDYDKTCLYLGYNSTVNFIGGFYGSKIRLGTSSSGLKTASISFVGMIPNINLGQSDFMENKIYYEGTGYKSYTVNYNSCSGRKDSYEQHSPYLVADTSSYWKWASVTLVKNGTASFDIDFGCFSTIKEILLRVGNIPDTTLSCTLSLYDDEGKQNLIFQKVLSVGSDIKMLKIPFDWICDKVYGTVTGYSLNYGNVYVGANYTPSAYPSYYERINHEYVNKGTGIYDETLGKPKWCNKSDLHNVAIWIITAKNTATGRITLTWNDYTFNVDLNEVYASNNNVAAEIARQLIDNYSVKCIRYANSLRIQYPTTADKFSASVSYGDTGVTGNINVGRTTARRTFVEADGAEAGVKRSGTDSQRPTSGIYVGFQYFDTTLGKVIVWDGSAWKNVDGTALS